VTNFDYLLNYYRLKDSNHFEQYITSKLADISFDDFLLYWRQSLPQLSKQRPDYVKCPYRFDCVAAINGFASARFRFQVGDTLIVGANGSALHFHDAEAAQYTLGKLRDKGFDDVAISDNNRGYWNRLLDEGKLTLSLQTIDQIKQARQ